MSRIIDRLGVNVGQLRDAFVQQLPTVAALIYCSQEEPDSDEAADEAVVLVDSLLVRIIEEIKT